MTADTAGDTTVITTTTVDMFLDDEDEDDETKDLPSISIEELLDDLKIEE